MWEALHQAIPYYKSLGTFYQHTKGQAESDYLAEVFSDRELKAVWDILGVHDAEIERLQKAAQSLSNKATDLLGGT